MDQSEVPQQHVKYLEERRGKGGERERRREGREERGKGVEREGRGEGRKGRGKGGERAGRRGGRERRERIMTHKEKVYGIGKGEGKREERKGCVE